jgi:hypothetical protein
MSRLNQLVCGLIPFVGVSCCETADLVRVRVVNIIDY